MSFSDKPGLLFVWATLLPLFAFTLLLILGGLRNFLRPYREQPAWSGLYRFLEHDVAGRGGFYVGFVGIVLAFLCCFSGFCLFLGEHHNLEDTIRPKEQQIEAIEKEAKQKNEDAHAEVHPIHEEIQEAQQKFDQRW